MAGPMAAARVQRKLHAQMHACMRLAFGAPPLLRTRHTSSTHTAACTCTRARCTRTETSAGASPVLPPLAAAGCVAAAVTVAAHTCATLIKRNRQANGCSSGARSCASATASTPLVAADIPGLLVTVTAQVASGGGRGRWGARARSSRKQRAGLKWPLPFLSPFMDTRECVWTKQGEINWQFC